ncbi:hypothetical protein EVAR_19771_1 [Eumeta japonica]|uniref:Uncharacterized protein n=1 Tax=Eumeta variegata TaxID=151549 RepID=A0A4C1UQY2_EUMVA|nr:hypothetical protein EVAR_19771_1 [Eumeta japonica]
MKEAAFLESLTAQSNGKPASPGPEAGVACYKPLLRYLYDATTPRNISEPNLCNTPTGVTYLCGHNSLELPDLGFKPGTFQFESETTTHSTPPLFLKAGQHAFYKLSLKFTQSRRGQLTADGHPDASDRSIFGSENLSEWSGPRTL